MSEPQSETPEQRATDFANKAHLCTHAGIYGLALDAFRELTTEREAKLEYLRRDAERNRQLVAEREARVKADTEAKDFRIKLIEANSKIAHGELAQIALRAKLASMEQERDLIRLEATKPAAPATQEPTSHPEGAATTSCVHLTAEQMDCDSLYVHPASATPPSITDAAKEINVGGRMNDSELKRVKSILSRLRNYGSGLL